MAGLSITVLGVPDTGKTLLTIRLKAELEKMFGLCGRVHLFGTESATEIGMEIKNLIVKHRNKPNTMSARTEVLLHMAKRVQFYEIIKQILLQGDIAITIHGPHSTKAYQGCGEGIDQHIIDAISEFATWGLFPQHPEVAILLYRDKVTSPGPDFKLSVDQLTIIQNGYLKMAKDGDLRWLPINIDQCRRMFEMAKDKKNFLFTTWDGQSYQKEIKDFWDIVFEYMYQKVKWALAARPLSADDSLAPIVKAAGEAISERNKKMSELSSGVFFAK